MIHLIIRGYADSVLQFFHRVEIPEEELELVVPKLAEKHAAALRSNELHMIEIEFLDEPDPNGRFFRFGTDVRGMVRPMRVNL